MNLYNNVIAYLYNNILTSNKPLCGRGDLWVQPIHVLYHFIIVYLFSYWYG